MVQWNTYTTRSNRTSRTEFGYYHISTWHTESGIHYLGTRYWQEYDEKNSITKNCSEDVCKSTLIQLVRFTIEEHYNQLVEEAKENESTPS